MIRKILLAIPLLLLGYYSYAVPSTGVGSLSGPTSVCGGSTQTYTLGSGTNVCFVGADFAALNGTVTSGGLAIQTPHQLTVRWDAVSTTTTGRISYGQQFQAGSCQIGAQTDYVVNEYNVTIRPNISSLPIPSPISKQIAQTNYVYSTSGSGAQSYQWQVISGGTIQGSSTGSSITVTPNSSTCNISVRVRSVATNCDNTTIYSPYRSLTDNLSVPGRPVNPSGQQYVGPAGATKTYGTGSATASSFRWYVQGNTFEIVGNPTGGSATVRCLTDATTATTLYVRAVNSCGESDAAFKTITGGINPPFLTDDGKGNEDELLLPRFENPVNLVHPNPVNSKEGTLTIDLLGTDKITDLRITNVHGQLVEELAVMPIMKLDVSQYAPGVYFIQSTVQGQTASTKFVVE